MAISPPVGTSPDAAGRESELVDKLYRSERRLHGILDTANEAFIAFDAEGLILDWNAASARIFGWDYLDALGRPLTEMFHVPGGAGTGGDGVGRLLAEDTPAGGADSAPRQLKLQALGCDGHRFPVEMSVSRHSAGDSHVWHAFLRDLTEQERVECERREAERKLAYQALHDDLTGLANRALLMDRLEHALELSRRRGSTVAVLFIDLDQFKLVNETLGHTAGDAVLVEVAARLRRTMRASDTRARRGQETMARMGADEFILVCEDITSEADACAIAQELADSLSSPLQVGAECIHTSASVGIALASPDATPQSLLRDADAATHRAKELGGARCESFDAGLRVRLLDRQRRENELRRAIDGNELRLHYQPIVSAFGGELVAVEALVRWQHPERGLLGPFEFLPLAEEVGLINQLGRWVLHEACEQSIRWRALRPDGPRLRVSVNVSGRQLASDNAHTLVQDILAHEGLDPSLLTLEITETVLLQDCEAPVEALCALRALGAQVLLDDFGTGYSSLSYLHRLPLDGIKLDRTFVAAITEAPVHREITRSVIQMADALNLKVVAEGVETQEQLSVLRQLGCPLLQGYYFAKPLAAEQVTELIEGSRAGLSPAVHL